MEETLLGTPKDLTVIFIGRSWVILSRDLNNWWSSPCAIHVKLQTAPLSNQRLQIKHMYHSCCVMRTGVASTAQKRSHKLLRETHSSSTRKVPKENCIAVFAGFAQACKKIETLVQPKPQSFPHFPWWHQLLWNGILKQLRLDYWQEVSKQTG